MKKLSDYKLCIADLETTGLDENDHEILEFGAIIYDPSTDIILNEWEKKVAPQHIETASSYALKINGYNNNPKLYNGSLKSGLIKFNSIARGCIMVGQNIPFDLKFLYKNMKDYSIRPEFERRFLDTMVLAWPVVHNTDIPGLSLEKLCDYFGISNVGAHSALADCHRTLGVYRCLMKIYEKQAQ